jgi:hypothetical protein
MFAKLHVRYGLLFVYLAFGMFSFHQLFGQDLVADGRELRISGHYSFIFKNGTPGYTNIFHFIALTAYDGWSISATNENNAKDWGLMRYDGTNIYTLISDVGFLHSGHTNKFEAYAYIYPGQFYVPALQDSVRLFFPWLVFHLSPHILQHSFEHNGIIEMPSPWGSSRYSLVDYGSKWMLKSSDDGQIIQRIDIIRDSELDLKTEEDELRRSMLDYPFLVSDREEVLKMLDFRKSIPNDFVRCSYECLETFHTNGLSIPSASQFAEFWPIMQAGTGRITPRLIYQCVLIVDQVELLNNVHIPDAIPPVVTSVFDYRYQATNSRTKFNYARYTLNAGDQFKSDKDPQLLAEAHDWLKHGPGYDSYKSKRILILVGMGVITAAFAGLLLFRLKPAKQL